MCLLALCVYLQRDERSSYAVAVIAVYWIEGINLKESEKWELFLFFFFFSVNKSTGIILKTLRQITVPETTYITHYVVMWLLRELD